jgi:hypothetical protein
VLGHRGGFYESVGHVITLKIFRNVVPKRAMFYIALLGSHIGIKPSGSTIIMIRKSEFNNLNVLGNHDVLNINRMKTMIQN